MADTTVKLSGTYDSIEAYNILTEMQTLGTTIEEYKDDAEAAATTASSAVSTVQGYANAANGYANNASTYAGNAGDSADEAAGYAANASTSATNAASSATNASNSAAAAATSETNAAASATNAAASEAVVNGALPLSGGTMTGTLTLADGGTALSNNVTGVSSSDYITVLSGYSIRGTTIRVIGGTFVRARIGINFNTSVSANSIVNAATVKAPYRPPTNTSVFGGSTDGVMTIDADGTVRLKPAVDKSNGSWVWADVFYSLI